MSRPLRSPGQLPVVTPPASALVRRQHKTVIMATLDVDPKRIRYSQSSVIKCFNLDGKGRDICSKFDTVVYDQAGLIKVVQYSAEQFTSYDNRRLYWAQNQPAIRCIVFGADCDCFEDECFALLHWQACDKVTGLATLLREAFVTVRNYKGWIALKCARQGLEFPLCGRTKAPNVGGLEPSINRPWYRLCSSPRWTCKDNHTSCANDLRDHLTGGGFVYVRMLNGKLLYLNVNWSTFFKENEFESVFECSKYCTYEGVDIKSIDDDQAKWSREDREAYESEMQQIKDDDCIHSDEVPEALDTPVSVCPASGGLECHEISTEASASLRTEPMRRADAEETTCSFGGLRLSKASMGSADEHKCPLPRYEDVTFASPEQLAAHRQQSHIALDGSISCQIKQCKGKFSSTTALCDSLTKARFGINAIIRDLPNCGAPFHSTTELRSVYGPDRKIYPYARDFGHMRQRSSPL